MLGIDKLYILPETFIYDAQVYAIAEVTTFSNGVHLGFEITREKFKIAVEDCFYVGMLTVINHFRVTIPLGKLEPGDYYLRYTACPSTSNEKCITDPVNCVSRELKFRIGCRYRLDFKKGWNLFSIGCRPLSNDSREFFKPLIESGSLIKVQDETGNALEDHGIFNPLGGWFCAIDSINPAEGYKIKVNSDCFMETYGYPVSYPFKIPLKMGWNLISFPQQSEADGYLVIKQLIENGNLIKIQDETGNSIENWGVFGGWQNHIGNFRPGEGYKMKVSAADTLTIYESYIK